MFDRQSGELRQTLPGPGGQLSFGEGHLLVADDDGVLRAYRPQLQLAAPLPATPADGDGDGLPDLVELATGSDPQRRDPENHPSLQAVDDGVLYRFAAFPAESGFRYTVEVSHDLRTWHEVESGAPPLGIAPFPEGGDPPEVELSPTSPDGGVDGAGQGKLNVTFQASELVQESEFLDAELECEIWANVFRADEVLVTGPIEGAEVLANIHVPYADLRGGIRSVPIITEDLPVTRVKILGFCDVDGNADPDDPGPDDGDPVTVPLTEFQVLEGLTAEVTVPFELVY